MVTKRNWQCNYCSILVFTTWFPKYNIQQYAQSKHKSVACCDGITKRLHMFSLHSTMSHVMYDFQPLT